jgi:hypothetical protein
MRAMNPEFFPDMARAPSVQTTSTRSHKRLLESKKSFTIAMLSDASVVSLRGSQKKNSSLIISNEHTGGGGEES